MMGDHVGLKWNPQLFPSGAFTLLCFSRTVNVLEKNKLTNRSLSSILGDSHAI